MLKTMVDKSANDWSPTMTRRKKVSCFFQAYNPMGQNAFEVTTAKLIEFPFKDILTHVNLVISDAPDTLLIVEEEHSEIKV